MTTDLQALEDLTGPQDRAATELLDALPISTASLADVPERLQRALYDAFHLKITYNRSAHMATLQITITGDALPTLSEPPGPSAERGCLSAGGQDAPS